MDFEDVSEKDTGLSIIGVTHKGTVTYNLLQEEGAFLDTGISILKFLRTNKNNFISEIYRAQSFESIMYVLDDKFVLVQMKNSGSDEDNVCTFKELHALFYDSNLIKNLYIYDQEADLLVFNTVDTGGKFIALDYKNSNDIRSFTRTIFDKDYFL